MIIKGLLENIALNKFYFKVKGVYTSIKQNKGCLYT